MRNLRLKLALALFLGSSATIRACTIFVLTDADRALFCNNEDWFNPRARIWFVPAGAGRYGCAFVGFDDGNVQGGLNTEGLALDAVAGYKEKWERDPSLPILWGSPTRRPLETCANVDEVIAFFRSHSEAGFASFKLLVSDRTGASVIIGAKDHKLQVEKSNNCQGIGYGRKVLAQELPKSPEPTVANGFKILRACLQGGRTKYSNIFDLKSGSISLFPFQDRDDEFHFDLATELKKGPHYYDMLKIAEQLRQEPRPLLANMKSWRLEDCKTIPDREPDVTAHVRAIIQDSIAGSMQANDYTKEIWFLLSRQQKDVEAQLKSFGDLGALTLVDRSEEDERRSYRYLLDFQRVTILECFVFDSQNRITMMVVEDGKEKLKVGAAEN